MQDCYHSGKPRYTSRGILIINYAQNYVFINAQLMIFAGFRFAYCANLQRYQNVITATIATKKQHHLSTRYSLYFHIQPTHTRVSTQRGRVASSACRFILVRFLLRVVMALANAFVRFYRPARLHSTAQSMILMRLYLINKLFASHVGERRARTFLY